MISFRTPKAITTMKVLKPHNQFTTDLHRDTVAIVAHLPQFISLPTELVCIFSKNHLGDDFQDEFLKNLAEHLDIHDT